MRQLPFREAVELDTYISSRVALSSGDVYGSAKTGVGCAPYDTRIGPDRACHRILLYLRLQILSPV